MRLLRHLVEVVVVHDVVLRDLPVMLAIDRAGVVGGDGPTHAVAYDATCQRCLPNIVVMAPADENETGGRKRHVPMPREFPYTDEWMAWQTATGAGCPAHECRRRLQ